MAPPSGDEAQASPPSEEVISEETLRAMTSEQLRDLCSKNGVTIPAEVTDKDLLDWLLAEFGVSE
jgi:hypothetical protein